MKTELSILKNFLVGLDYTENSPQLKKLLNELELFLSDSDIIHHRIIMLRTLEKLRKQNHHDELKEMKVVQCQLSSDQFEICVRKGISKACMDGDISPKDMLTIPHSVDGLNAFSEALFITPPDERSSCWKDALKLPENKTVPGENPETPSSRTKHQASVMVPVKRDSQTSKKK